MAEKVQIKKAKAEYDLIGRLKKSKSIIKIVDKESMPNKKGEE